MLKTLATPKIGSQSGSAVFSIFLYEKRSQITMTLSPVFWYFSMVPLAKGITKNKFRFFMNKIHTFVERFQIRFHPYSFATSIKDDDPAIV